jgi:hypothetical protein
LDYSVGVLKKKRHELRNNPILKQKIDNYLLMQRLYINQELNNGKFPFDIIKNINTYINEPSNKDLLDYMNLCKHIIARELDMAELCSKIDFNDNLFVLEGKDLFCVASPLSTAGSIYNDIEKDFLCSCAKRNKRIVKVNTSNPENRITPLYTNDTVNANMLRAS